MGDPYSDHQTGCSKEAREPTSRVRYISRKDAESQKGRLSGRRRASYPEGQVRRDERRCTSSYAGRKHGRYYRAVLLGSNYKDQIKEAEGDSITDLGAFLDAEINYYDRCRDVLAQLKEAWPAGFVLIYAFS